eukprot:4383537-Prymnesium_polylepis.1
MPVSYRFLARQDLIVEGRAFQCDRARVISVRSRADVPLPAPRPPLPSSSHRPVLDCPSLSR